MRRTQLFLLCSLVVIAFLGGTLFGKMIHLNIFTFQRDINPVHALSVLGTIFIAIFLSVLIDRERSKDKYEKDLILRRIDSIQDIVDSVHASISMQQIQLVDATSKIKRIRSSVRCVYAAVSSARKTCAPAESTIESRIKTIDSLMTLTPIKTKADTSALPIEVKKGLVTYSAARATEVETEIEILKNMLFDLQMCISRSYPLG